MLSWGSFLGGKVGWPPRRWNPVHCYAESVSYTKRDLQQAITLEADRCSSASIHPTHAYESYNYRIGCACWRLCYIVSHKYLTPVCHFAWKIRYKHNYEAINYITWMHIWSFHKKINAFHLHLTMHIHQWTSYPQNVTQIPTSISMPCTPVVVYRDAHPFHLLHMWWS